MSCRSNKLVSIIVPIYNKEKYLGRCLTSIQNQTYTNLEIILVDDGSTDDSLLICEKYAHKDSRIQIVKKRNGGVSSARNCGLSKKTGEYIGFVDPDDWIELTCVEEMLDCLEKNKADIVYCKEANIYESNGSRIVEGDETGKAIVFPREEFSWVDSRISRAVVWGALYKESIIDNLHFAEDLSIGEDVLFFAQAIKKANVIVKLDKALYNYSRNEDSVTSAIWSEKRLCEIEARRRIKGLFNDNERLLREAKAGYALVLMRVIAGNCQNKDFIKNHYRHCITEYRKDAKVLCNVLFRKKHIRTLIKAMTCLISPELYMKWYKTKLSK